MYTYGTVYDLIKTVASVPDENSISPCPWSKKSEESKMAETQQEKYHNGISELFRKF